MRSRILLVPLMCLLFTVPALSFEDDFEDGLGNWTGDWQLTTEQAHGGSYSITDSPGADYAADMTYNIEMATGEDLSDALGAELSFWVRADTEADFDYWYLDITTDGGEQWHNLYTEAGQFLEWREMTFDIGGYVGNADVRVRFQLISDGGTEEDGLWIDDVSIIGNDEDTSPPLIVHSPIPENSAVDGIASLTFTFLDISGFGDIDLYYTVDGGDEVTVSDYTVNAEDYTFEIPVYPAGSRVEYYVIASDGAEPANEGEYGPFSYYCGTMLCYDDSDVAFINSPSADYSYTTQFTVEEELYLVGLFFRFYMDPSHGLDSVDVKVWEYNDGEPGDVIYEMAQFPGNEEGRPYQLTFVDLRDAMILVTDEFYAGYTNRASIPVIGYTSPAVSGRSLQNTGGTWSDFSGDLHIRALVGQREPTEVTCEAIQTDPNLDGEYIRTSGIITLAPNTTWTTRTEAWIQDETGYGVKLFQLEPTENVFRGDEVDIVGFVDEFMGTTRIVDYTLQVLSTGNDLPEPLTGTTAEMAAYATMEGSWAEITGILQDEPPDQPTSVTLNVDDGSGPCEMRLFVTSELDLTGYEQYDGITVRGPLYVEGDAIQIVPSVDADIEPADGLEAPVSFDAVIDSVKGEVALSWSFGFVEGFERFHIFRDDELLDTLVATSFSDTLTEHGDYAYTLVAEYINGMAACQDTVFINWVGSNVPEGVFAGIPEEFGIAATYPNPFNSAVSVMVAVADPSEVKTVVFNLLGRNVATIHSGQLTAGYHRFVWNADNLPTGVYFLRTTTSNGEKAIRKITYVK